MDDAKRILIFEDNASIQMLLRIFFQKRGYQTQIAGDGVQAVALANEYKPDLIIMDVIMPGKGGLEACQELRQEGVKTPIIMLTSKSFPEDPEKGLAAGANAYLFKPFNPKDLEAAVRSLLVS